uniref:Small nuclear ribonucleoprotein Sm D3 n=3 Tax=Chondrichthyes TaxID=7777 RepID=A0A4W3IVM0_CALMI|eukprot:gi/632967374/ref/XP_007899944.1/ PREDICTED: small nuclear ribonucleoprotein Sm D3 [Callorhinchus milii]
MSAALGHSAADAPPNRARPLATIAVRGVCRDTGGPHGAVCAGIQEDHTARCLPGYRRTTLGAVCAGIQEDRGETLLGARAAAMSIGVPIKVLHEAEGHIVTCETNTGEVYRGKLIEAEDNMNCQMSNITVTYRDGRVAQLEQVYIRGSKIRFLILPDMLKNAPMLKSMKNKNQGTGAGRGKAAILKAQVAARGRGRGMGRGNIFQKRR